MINRTTKLKWRRLIRRRRRQVTEIGSVSEQNLDRLFIRRLVRLPTVRRFLFGWIGLLFLLSVGVVLQTRALSDKYQTVQARQGGTFTEGIIGSFTNASPLYAANPVDSSVSKLIFSGLLQYDSQNKLVGDIAESYTIDESETIYTFKLKRNVRWHDGQPVTAKDVVFTYGLIQNPETKSFLYPSWQNIKVQAVDPWTVTFTLSSSLSSFPNSLTNGIVPEHILGKINPAQLRSSPFNNESPVGSGPFKFSKIEVVGTTPEDRQERIAFDPNDRYHNGKPKLGTFIIRTFANEKDLAEAYKNKDILAAVGLAATPEGMENDNTNKEYSIPLTSEVLVFFKTSQEVLKDPVVRRSLVLATNKKEILDKLNYPLTTVDSPLLKTHVGYDKSLSQVTDKMAEAKQQLDAAGWVADAKTGIRAKNGAKLSFRLTSENTSEFTSVSGSLQKQWREIGADVKVELQAPQEFQGALSERSYDALLYGVALGPDPDVYAYWHSTQADPRSRTRLNFSEYTSTTADRALEGGRTRSDPQIRTAKYKPFLEAWRNDAPALALYQPRFLYLVRQPFYGFDMTSVNSAPDRYSNVENWMIRQGKQDIR